jgi:charged multivesicular body protein 1
MFGLFSKPKPAPPKMDMTDMLINMKMKAKMFERESNKAEKEKKKQLDKAKLCLKKGNEEGARLYCDLAQQKHNESMQYMKMSHRLEVVAGQIKSKTKSMELMDSLNQFTPFLQQASAEMPLE